MSGEMVRRPPSDGDEERSRASRRQLASVGVACLLIGALLGVAAGGDEEPKVETVTQVDTVTRVKTERVPVVKTVTHVRRVVRTQTQTVTEQVAAPSEPPASAVADAGGAAEAAGGADYAGMNCSEIGHSYTVEPGSDPQHDADNDGVACESY